MDLEQDGGTIIAGICLFKTHVASLQEPDYNIVQMLNYSC